MEFLVALAGLIGLMVASIVFLRGGLVGGSLLVLLAGSCFGHTFFNLPTGAIPLTGDRFLLVVLGMQYLVYRRWGWTDPKPLATADCLLAAFLAVLVVSTFTHDVKTRNSLPLSQLLFFYLMPAAMYWAARQTELTKQAALWIFASIALFGVYLCVTSVAEVRQAWWLVFPKYIASPNFHEFYGRGRGPFLNPAGMGFFIGVGLMAALLWWPRANRAGQLGLLLFVIPLFCLGAYCTLTRSVWMGLAAGLATLAALCLPRVWRFPVLGASLILGTIAVAAAWNHLTMFKRDKEVSVQDMAESAQLRPILAAVAWRMFLDSPVLGCGFGQYADASPAYLSDRGSELPLEKARPYIQHNVFLGLLTETGIVGLGLFAAVLCSWTLSAWRLWRSADAPLWTRQVALLMLATLAVYLPNGMFHNVAVIPMFNMLLFFIAGVSQNLAPLAATERTTTRLKVWLPAGARA